MVTIEEVEEIHRILINEFGGSHGVRDITALPSALARPFQTFDNNDLYYRIVDNKYKFVINVASGVLKFDGIVFWLKTNTQ